MKVYVLYILSDYSQATYMSTKEELCQKELKRLKKRVNRPMWIEEYDFSKSIEYHLDID